MPETPLPLATFMVDAGATFWVVATDENDALWILRALGAMPDQVDDDEVSVRRMEDDEKFTEFCTGDGQKDWTGASFARERPDGLLTTDY